MQHCGKGVAKYFPIGGPGVAVASSTRRRSSAGRQESQDATGYTVMRAATVLFCDEGSDASAPAQGSEVVRLLAGMEGMAKVACEHSADEGRRRLRGSASPGAPSTTPSTKGRRGLRCSVEGDESRNGRVPYSRNTSPTTTTKWERRLPKAGSSEQQSAGSKPGRLGEGTVIQEWSGAPVTVGSGYDPDLRAAIRHR